VLSWYHKVFLFLQSFNERTDILVHSAKVLLKLLSHIVNVGESRCLLVIGHT
jgi:hypothetical protein